MVSGGWGGGRRDGWRGVRLGCAGHSSLPRPDAAAARRCHLTPPAAPLPRRRPPAPPPTMRGPEVQSRPLAAQLVPRAGCSGRVAAHAPPAQLRQQPRLRLRAPCDTAARRPFPARAVGPAAAAAQDPAAAAAASAPHEFVLAALAAGRRADVSWCGFGGVGGDLGGWGGGGWARGAAPARPCSHLPRPDARRPPSDPTTLTPPPQARLRLRLPPRTRPRAPGGRFNLGSRPPGGAGGRAGHRHASRAARQPLAPLPPAGVAAPGGGAGGWGRGGTARRAHGGRG